jgi:hypothetical protein
MLFNSKGNCSLLHAENFPTGAVSVEETDVARMFSFVIEADLGKVVSLFRTGRSVKVVIRYVQIVTVEETEEQFEADGPLSIVEADSGIYVTSYRSLLSDRIRLRRTRFF